MNSLLPVAQVGGGGVARRGLPGHKAPRIAETAAIVVGDMTFGARRPGRFHRLRHAAGLSQRGVSPVWWSAPWALGLFSFFAGALAIGAPSAAWRVSPA